MSNPGTINLTAYWALDEASGTRYDSHGSADLTDNNTVGNGTGKQGNAADFESTNVEYLSRASEAALLAGDIDITLGAWVKVESLVNNMRVMSKRLSAGDCDYDLWFFGTTGDPIFQMSDASNTRVSVTTTGEPVSTGTWAFIVAWHDAANSTAYIQVNNGTPFSSADSGTPVTGTGAFMLGNIDQVDRAFDGLIDEAFIYKRVLTSAERTWLYNSGDGRTYSDIADAGTTKEIADTGSGSDAIDGLTVSLTLAGTASGADVVSIETDIEAPDAVNYDGVNTRVTIGDKTGRRLAEINPQLNVVSWRRNKVSKIPIELVRNDQHLIQSNFRPGNRILVEFDNGLPPWGGIIDPPSRWTLDSYKTSGYSAEQLLLHRQTDRGRYFDSARASYIFSSVLEEAEDFVPAELELGLIEDDAGLYYPDYHFEPLLSVAESLVDLAGVDFWVEAGLADGRITFYARMAQRRGQVKQRVTLQEGLNIAEITLDEAGPIVNDWVLAGAGQGWADERIYAAARDEESISKYGLRQASSVYSDISVQGTLDARAEALLEASRKPGNRWSVEAQNVKPALFSSYDVGDVVRLIAPNFGWNGFDGYVSIEARYFDTATDECVLVVEEDTSV